MSLSFGSFSNELLQQGNFIYRRLKDHPNVFTSIRTKRYGTHIKRITPKYVRKTYDKMRMYVEEYNSQFEKALPKM